MHLRWPAALSAAAVTVLLSACQGAPSSPPSPTPTAAPASTCEDLAVQIVDAVQDYVDSFAGVDAGGVANAANARQGEFAETTAALRERGDTLGCEPDGLADLVRAELARLEGGTPVQDAIADTFRADPLGTVDPSDPQPVVTTVSSGPELAAALLTVGSGSQITLSPGEYVFTAPLVVLRAVTLIGAGADETRISSSSPGAALIVATTGDLRLVDLALAHVGEEPASVALVASGGYAFERVRVSGARSDTDGVGGFGVVLRPDANPLTGGGTLQRLTDVEAADNEGGGIVVGGTAQPTITGASITGASGCGICFVESGGGTVEDSQVTGVQAGLRVDDDAAPAVARLTVVAAQAGIAVTGAGAPTVRNSDLEANATGAEITGTGRPFLADSRITGSLDVGVRVSGRSRALLSGLSVTGSTTAGLAVVADAQPRVTGGEIATTGEVGAIWAERAAGTADGVTVRGARLALQFSDESAPEVTDAVVSGAGAASGLANGSSAARVVRLTCASGDAATFGLAEQTTTTLSASPTCDILDER